MPTKKPTKKATSKKVKNDITHKEESSHVSTIVLGIIVLATAAAAIASVIATSVPKAEPEPVIEPVVIEEVEEEEPEIVEVEIPDSYVAFEDYTVGDQYTFTQLANVDVNAYIPNIFGEVLAKSPQDQLFIRSNNETFLAVLINEPVSDRGGYWGDLGYILRDHDLNAICDVINLEPEQYSWINECEIIENSEGVSYAWLKGTYTAFQDTPQENSNVYIFEHPAEDMTAVVVSDIRMQTLNNEFDATDTTIRVWVRTIAESLTFGVDVEEDVEPTTEVNTPEVE